MGRYRRQRDYQRHDFAVFLPDRGISFRGPVPRAARRTNLRTDLIRAAQFAIGEELRTHFQTPLDQPRSLRIKIEQLAFLYD